MIPVLVEGIKAGASIAVEPVDWVLTVKDIVENGPNLTHLLAIIPFVPRTTGKVIKTVNESAQSVKKVEKAASNLEKGPKKFIRRFPK